jgi:hypothetical protein
MGWVSTHPTFGIGDCGILVEIKTVLIIFAARSGASSQAANRIPLPAWGALSVLIYIYFTTFNDLFTDPYRILTLALHRFTQLLRMNPLCAHYTLAPVWSVTLAPYSRRSLHPIPCPAPGMVMVITPCRCPLIQPFVSCVCYARNDPPFTPFQ